MVRQQYDEATAATMETSSAALDSVWELCRYTGEATTLDLIADSNARQRSFDCMADDNTAMRLLYATTPQLALQRLQLKQALTACGSIDGDKACRAEWTVLPLIMVRDDALHTGDLSVARAHFDKLAPSSLFKLINATSGLVQTDNVLVDWPPGMRDGFVVTANNAVANAFAVYGLGALVDLATWLGRTADAARYQEIKTRLKATINLKLWNGKAFCDGPCSAVHHTAFHSTVYLLALGAVSEANTAAAWTYVRSRITPPASLHAAVDDVADSTTNPNPNPNPKARQRSMGSAPNTGSKPRQRLGKWPPPPPPGARYGMPCGTYVSQFVLQALYQGNPGDHGSAALAVLTSTAKHSWLNMLKQGATTTMEMWAPDEKPNLTWSHPWAASPGFIIPWFLFGIRPLAPGWRKMVIQPAPGALKYGQYTLPTILGPVRASFKQQQQQQQQRHNGDLLEGTTDLNGGSSRSGNGSLKGVGTSPGIGTNGKFKLTVSLPVGTSARVALPVPREWSCISVDWSSHGRLIKSFTTPALTVDDQGYVVATSAAGGGQHEFEASAC